MRMNKLMDVIHPIRVPDGIGGFTEQDELLGRIYSHIVPMTSEAMNTEYGVSTNKGSKIISKDDVPDNHYLECEQCRYKILKKIDTSRLKIYLVECI